MPLYWLVYRHNNSISVVIEPGASLIHARIRSAIAELDQGEFTEGHELDRKWRVPKQMIGRRLSQIEAKGLLARFDRHWSLSIGLSSAGVSVIQSAILFLRERKLSLMNSGPNDDQLASAAIKRLSH